MNDKPSLDDVRNALARLENIPRPDGDNEGDPINHDTVYPYLSSNDQSIVDQAVEKLVEYTREIGGGVDARSITYLNKSGYHATLQESQHEIDFLVGEVEVGDWKIDISDQPVGSHD